MDDPRVGWRIGRVQHEDRRARTAQKGFCPRGHRPLQFGVEWHAVPGVMDGGFERTSERQLRIVFCQVSPGGGDPGDAGSQGTVQRPVAVHVSVRIQVQVAVGGQRGAFAGVQHRGVVSGTVVQEEEAAAADSRTVGLHDAQDCRNRNGRIEGIAAGIEDFEAGFGRGRVRGRQGMSGWIGRGRRQAAGQEEQAEQQGRPFHQEHASEVRVFQERLRLAKLRDQHLLDFPGHEMRDIAAQHGYFLDQRR